VKSVQESGTQTRNDNRRDESAGGIKRGKMKKKGTSPRLSRDYQDKNRASVNCNLIISRLAS